MKKAVLVIDFINGIVRDGACKAWADSHPIIENTNKIISAARAKSIPVYFIRLAFDDVYSNLPKHSKLFNRIKENKLFHLTDESTEFVIGLDIQKKDRVFNKTGSSPFVGNDLEEQLRKNNVEHLIFTGVATDNAIAAGVRYAHDAGFYTTLVEDTFGAAHEALHKPILKALDKIANEITDTDLCIQSVIGNPNTHLINPEQYHFLNEVKSHYEHIKQEYLAYINDKKINQKVLTSILNTKSSIIKPGELEAKHRIVPFYLHRKKLIAIIKEYELTFEGISLNDIEETLSYIEQNHFQKTKELIDKLYNNQDNGIIDVYFSVISRDSKVKLHVNNDPYMHRAYLGIDVPKGDVAMKMQGEHIKWIEGDFIVLDVTHPHCPHNYTQSDRVALIIDFYKPEENRSLMEQWEHSKFIQRMKDNPYGYGIYGTDDAVDQAMLEKFGEWGENLLQA